MSVAMMLALVVTQTGEPISIRNDWQLRTAKKEIDINPHPPKGPRDPGPTPTNPNPSPKPPKPDPGQDCPGARQCGPFGTNNRFAIDNLRRVEVIIPRRGVEVLNPRRGGEVVNPGRNIE